MYSLLGPHVNQTHGGIVDLISRWKPPLVVSVDPNPAWGRLAHETPRTTLIARGFPTDAHNPDFSQDFDVKARASDMVHQAHARWRDVPAAILSILNEPVVNSPEAMRRLAAFDAHCALVAAGLGRRITIGNFAVGNPPDLRWLTEYLPAMQAGRDRASLFNYHAYNWPTLQTPDQDWYTLRLRLIYQGDGQGWHGFPASLRIRAVCGEAGLDNLANRNPWERKPQGWNGHIPGDAYLAQLNLLSAQLMDMPYVVGAAVFCCGNISPSWTSYDIWPGLAEEIASHATPVYRPTDYLPPRTRWIDVSQWQGKSIDWQAVHDSGIQGSFIRASVRSKADPLYHHNCANLARVDGLQRGAYHYLYAEPSMLVQVSTFIRQLRGSSPDILQQLNRDLPLAALDVEENDLTDAQVREFCDRFAQVMGYDCGIYTSASKANRIKLGDWAGSHWLWVADWADRLTPRLPAPWRGKSWLFWQYTNRLRVEGITRPVDANYCAG